MKMLWGALALLFFIFAPGAKGSAIMDGNAYQFEFPALPSLPCGLRRALPIDGADLEARARRYGESHPDRASREDFLFVRMPADLFREIMEGEAGPRDLTRALGLLLYSGYEGGRWLQGVLREGGGKGIGGGMLALGKAPTALILRGQARRRLGLIEHGSARAKRRGLAKAFDGLILTYGYNRGYLLKILEHPPAGEAGSAEFLTCAGLLTCSYHRNSAVLDPLLPVRGRLLDPPSPAWRQPADKLKKRLPGSITRGEDVWEGIRKNGRMRPEAYAALADVSAEFLMLNEAVMLASAQALAEGGEAEMDRVLAADTALRVWLLGYIIGLGADGRP